MHNHQWRFFGKRRPSIPKIRRFRNFQIPPFLGLRAFNRKAMACSSRFRFSRYLTRMSSTILLVYWIESDLVSDEFYFFSCRGLIDFCC